MNKIVKVIEDLRKNPNDECYTQIEDIQDLKNILNQEMLDNYSIKHPFDTKESNFVELFVGIASHINQGFDYFDLSFNEKDLIISNPPFSKITPIIEKLEKDKCKFILLVNTFSLLEGKRGKMIKENGWSLIIPKKRMKFWNPTKNKMITVPGGSLWLTNIETIEKNKIIFL